MRGEPVRVAAAPADPTPAAGATQGPPGRPLDSSVRAAFEPRFGTSFADVRLHEGAEVDEAARSIRARAFTIGRDVAFAAGEYAPATAEGGHMLAHELAHVAQHPAGGPATAVYRFPYETRGVDLSRTSITNLTGVSYWLARTADRYDLTPTSRMTGNAEEQDAVLAALWAQNPPATVAAASEIIVPIQARPAAAAGAAAPPALLYRFRFSPPAAAGAKPGLVAEFLGEGAGAIPAPAPAPAAGFVPGPLVADSSGFADRALFLSTWSQEHAQLMTFLASAPPVFDRMLTTTTTVGTSTRHQSLLHVHRAAATGPTVPLNVDLVSESAPAAAVALPADYRVRDAGDFELDKLRRPPRAVADRLGTVALPSGLAADERLAVNLAIAGYFDTGHARNTEVDAIVPVGASGTRTILFTLRFGAGNDVAVERVGAAGTGAGQVNTGRIDVTRVNGFPGATAADSALRGWWTTRYASGGALTTPVPAPPNNTALIAEMSGLIRTGSATTAWFLGNYGLEIMDGPTTASRIQTTHAVPPAMTTDTVDFSTADLAGLEIALQTLANGEFAHLRGVKMGRKNGSIEKVGGTWQAGPATLHGLTLWNSAGTERTILYFDNLTANDGLLFRGGGAATALPDSTMTRVHELGHATERHAGIRAAFIAWRTAHAQAAPTWYAASNVAEELFPEAFALFHTDPHFLCSSAPLMYAWFLELANSGTPPAATAILTPPASCPP
jgi:hypothetical protein